jgi:hypothetical protein
LIFLNAIPELPDFLNSNSNLPPMAIGKIKRPTVRSLKINKRYRARKQVPEIKLCGNWLEKSGFEKGKRVSVVVMEKVIIVKAED